MTMLVVILVIKLIIGCYASHIIICNKYFTSCGLRILQHKRVMHLNDLSNLSHSFDLSLSTDVLPLRLYSEDSMKLFASTHSACFKILKFVAFWQRVLKIIILMQESSIDQLTLQNFTLQSLLRLEIGTEKYCPFCHLPAIYVLLYYV